MSDYNRRTSAGMAPPPSGRSNRRSRRSPRRTGLMPIGGDLVSVGNGIQTIKNLVLVDNMAILQIAGYHDTALTPGTSEGQLLDLIESMGFVIVEKDELSEGIDNLKNFTFAGSTNIDETIDNPNITDPNLSLLTPNKIKTTDKFKSATDPFYELDEYKTDNLDRRDERMKSREKKNYKKFKFLAQSLSANIRSQGVSSKMLNRKDRRSRI